jgi:hypothetical protein
VKVYLGTCNYSPCTTTGLVKTDLFLSPMIHTLLHASAGLHCGPCVTASKYLRFMTGYRSLLMIVFVRRNDAVHRQLRAELVAVLKPRICNFY